MEVLVAQVTRSGHQLCGVIDVGKFERFIIADKVAVANFFQFQLQQVIDVIKIQCKLFVFKIFRDRFFCFACATCF